MAVPLDIVRAFHNAFRRDLKEIDAAAYIAAQGHDTLVPVIKRYVFFNEVLVWHATGEERFVFPAVDSVAPLVAEAYARDHRGLDALFDKLDEAVKAANPLAVARATASFHFFSNFHLNKEEAHLYRIFNERVALPDQWTIAQKISQVAPRERFPEVVNWLFPLIGIDDRENMVRVFQRFMPAPAFTQAARLIESAVGGDWGELVLRVPELQLPVELRQ
jgi:hypothetical protein